MENAEIAFLENLSYGPILNTSNLISLDPQVSYELQQLSRPYRILEDLYDEARLRKQEREYFLEQLKWFSDFDHFLQRRIPLCQKNKIPLATANYLRLKYCVDTILINAIILNEALERLKREGISKVTYYPTNITQDGRYSIFNFKAKNRWTFQELLRLSCEKQGIAFELGCFVREKLEKTDYAVPPTSSWIKWWAKGAAHFLKFKKYARTKSLSGMAAFFMHAGGYDVDQPLRELLTQGMRIYVNERDGIVREDKLFRSREELPDVVESERKFLEGISKKIASEIHEDHELVRWFSNRAPINIASVLLPFLENFIGQEIPRILCRAIRMDRFFGDRKIRYVFSRANTDRNSLGTLVAAKYMGSAQSSCIEHASFAVDHEVFGVMDTETYHRTFARDEVSEDFLNKSRKTYYPTSCRVTRSTHYLSHVRRAYGKPCFRRNLKTVIYVEKKFSDRVRCFNNMNYPLAWYFEFQKKLIDLFAGRTDFQFIYKHADSPSQCWAKESTLRYLAGKRASNITVFRGSFLASLSKGDRVILDSPSGALFEAAAAGKSTLCLCADYLRILPKAKSVFRDTLAPFHDLADVARVVNSFLDAGPDQFRSSLSLDQKSFSEIFQETISNRNEVP